MKNQNLEKYDSQNMIAKELVEVEQETLTPVMDPGGGSGGSGPPF